MRSTFAGLALVAAVVAKPVPQSSSSCETSYDGAFNIQVVNATTSKVKRQSSDAITLTITLSDGNLVDSEGRIGNIASNKQFQFDAGQPQAGATAGGFAVCGGYLAHDGDVTTWDACKSGGFSNLYTDNTIAAGNPGQCTEVTIQVLPVDGSAATVAATTAAATQVTDGQPQATVATTAAATQITDGQPQATVASSPVATQITDGQVQATVASPVATQITDGQVQATVVPATQITDGQVQATVVPPPVAPCTQIVDGQPQCPVASGTGVAPYPGANTTVVGAAPSASVVPATGAASSFTIGSSVVGFVAAVAALAMF